MINASLVDQFPILSQTVNGQPLVYLDNAATTQKPAVVIAAIVDYYERLNSNVHRGAHHLSQLSTDAFELTRSKLKSHLHAAHEHEIIFTKGTTDSINLVAHGFRSFLSEGDEILVSEMAHHSNLVPWQITAKLTGATLRIIPMTPEGEMDLSAYENLLSKHTKLVAFSHISNALGSINPVKTLTDMAHAHGAAVLVDGAQALPHTLVDVQDLGVDFYAASAHKMYGPTGIGMLYGRSEWLNKLPPYQGGGEMIAEVSATSSTYADLPYKFEAGTPNIEAVIAWGTAIDWMNQVGIANIEAHETELLAYGHQLLAEIPGLILYGSPRHKAAVLSFNIDGLHPYDVGTLLDQMGIAVRTGQHCAQPIMTCLQVPGTIRASLAVYTRRSDLEALASGLKRAINALT